ncbi:NADH-quinone oxidoreductase subunit J family protein [Fodinibius salsisoli]|uniref:NADH-quinone oxidoreductase subunit J n=1 Tax=Fodinibius salsisoli TaxID=2820877 RepID=A0ABT3PRA7_9BACT|nr:NADH-quinone oxidoreductase subunit J [Fodinibius salsisoli]MCW9708395.1 NADH-quinone oxidoreductase subunit J [Fodinibius salsisoli]
MITYSFIFLAVLAVATALGLVISKNTVNSALFLVLNMVSLSGVYLLLQAQFLAIIQILVYAGAIMVLFLFVIMLLNIDEEESLFNKFRIKYFVAFLLGVGIFAQLIYSIGSFSDTLPVVSAQMAEAGTVEAIGDVLYTKYSLPFHIIAMLLTAAVNGALLVAQHKTKPLTEEND